MAVAVFELINDSPAALALGWKVLSFLFGTADSDDPGGDVVAGILSAGACAFPVFVLGIERDLRCFEALAGYYA